MSQEEMFIRLICLEKSLKKANYRIYLLEKKKTHAEETKKFIMEKETLIQLDLFQAVGQ